MSGQIDEAEVARIAKRLTKAQGSFLLGEERGYRFVSGYRPGEKLVALGLLKREQATFGRRITITPLGLAVRARLERQP